LHCSLCRTGEECGEYNDGDACCPQGQAAHGLLAR
jgi:hypothetical protein